MNVGKLAQTSSFPENTISFKVSLLFKDVHTDSEV